MESTHQELKDNTVIIGAYSGWLHDAMRTLTREDSPRRIWRSRKEEGRQALAQCLADVR